MAFSRSRRPLPRPARPRVPGQAAPPPVARQALLSAIEAAGHWAAAYSAAREPASPDELAEWAAMLRKCWLAARALRVGG